VAREQKEDIKELLEQFYEAEEAAEDIRKGEQLFAERPAPEPGPQLIANIKAVMAAELVRRRAKRQRRLFIRIAAAFAAAAIITLSVLYTPESQKESPRIISSSVWESENIAEADPEFSLLNDEADEIKNELLALRLGENNDYEYSEVIRLETELEEINGDFWKG